MVEEEKNNKRPMGHIAHLRKQFKSLNKYDYIITLIKRRKKKLYEKLLVLHLKKFESGSGEEDFFNFVNAFSLFRNYLPLEKGGSFHLNKLESPSHKDVCAQFWLKLEKKMKM